MLKEPEKDFCVCVCAEVVNKHKAHKSSSRLENKPHTAEHSIKLHEPESKKMGHKKMKKKIMKRTRAYSDT